MGKGEDEQELTRRKVEGKGLPPEWSVGLKHKEEKARLLIEPQVEKSGTTGMKL